MDYVDPVFMLPFDHRASFSKGLLGFEPPLTAAQHALVSSYKAIVFSGFKRIYEKESIKKRFAILVDEEFGAPILAECRKKRITFAVSVEKSGQDVFDFEYAQDFRAHLNAIKPTFAKVLVRYNPVHDNSVQVRRLKELSDFLVSAKIHLMFELLVPATDEQRRQYGPDYDTRERPRLMAQAIREIAHAGIAPSVWKIEAVETEDDWRLVISATRCMGAKPGIIVLGRGEDEKKVELWLRIAARFPEVTGFAVGRTVFNAPLEAFRDEKMTRARAVVEISKNYAALIRLWEASRRAKKA